MTDWASVEINREISARRYRCRFSILANHGTGSSHPLDRERWFAFLLCCHRDRCELDTDMLQRWLMEQGDWSFERASDLAIEYEFGRGLLKFAERNA